MVVPFVGGYIQVSVSGEKELQDKIITHLLSEASNIASEINASQAVAHVPANSRVGPCGGCGDS